MGKYEIIACGGTFDLLHAGHKHFLEQVLNLSEKVVIGLTSDAYISNNKPNRGIAPFEERKNILETFLREIGAGKRTEIIQIDDFYGPLLDPDFEVDSLVVSENRENAMKINIERESRGLKALEVVEVELKRGGDGQKLSSTRIREGEVDREGKNLILPSTLRYLLQDVWGEILENIPQDLDPNRIITVGDVTTQNFRDLKIYPKISIVDFKVGRKIRKLPFSAGWRIRARFRQAETGTENQFENENIVKVKNPAGTVSDELSEAVRNALKNNTRSVIIVDGEEDLAVLPCLLYAPLGYEIYYGQPNVGLVRIKVTKEIKKKTRELIEKFEKA
jgi:pantetheine-phosphate adenylyltransferase